MIGIIILLVLDSCLAEGFTTDREGGFSSSCYGKGCGPGSWCRARVLLWVAHMDSQISWGPKKLSTSWKSSKSSESSKSRKTHLLMIHDRGTWSQFCRAILDTRLFLRNAILQRLCSQWPRQCDTGHIMCLWKWEVFPQFLVTLGWTKNLGDTMGYHILRERQLWGFP